MPVGSAAHLFVKSAIAALAFCFAAVPAVAQEFWLEPENFAPDRGSEVVIHHYYGKNFNGDDLPFVAAWQKRYFAVDGRRERQITGYEGDLPAATARFLKPGLKIVAFDGTTEMQNFEGWDRYASFLDEDGLGHISERYLPADKLKKNISKSFTRKAKLLLGVGAANGKAYGRDRPVGLRLELIAGKNPYELKAGSTMPVRLLFDGEPVGNETILAFNKKEPDNPSKAVTDERGRAEILLPVAGPYLLSAVHIFKALPTDDADWSSIWTSLTFEVE